MTIASLTRLCHPTHNPLHDRVEAFPIERVSAVNAYFGNEVAGDLGHDAVSVARVLVVRARHDERGPRADGGEHVVRVELLSEPGYGLEERDAGVLTPSGGEAAHGAADAGEATAGIDRRVVECRVSPVRMSGHAHPLLVQVCDVAQDAQGTLRIVQALPHQQVAIEEPVGHGVVVLDPIPKGWLDAATRDPSILEGDRVGRQHGESSARERWTEGLIRAANIARDLALPEMELAVVLVEDHHPAVRCSIVRREEERRDEVSFESLVLDALSAVPVRVLRGASSERHGPPPALPVIPPLDAAVDAALEDAAVDASLAELPPRTDGGLFVYDDPRGVSRGPWRVVRGGDARLPWGQRTSALRRLRLPTEALPWVGVRCAYDP